MSDGRGCGGCLVGSRECVVRGLGLAGVVIFGEAVIVGDVGRWCVLFVQGVRRAREHRVLEVGDDGRLEATRLCKALVRRLPWRDFRHDKCIAVVDIEQ